MSTLIGLSCFSCKCDEVIKYQASTSVFSAWMCPWAIPSGHAVITLVMQRLLRGWMEGPDGGLCSFCETPKLQVPI